MSVKLYFVENESQVALLLYFVSNKAKILFSLPNGSQKETDDPVVLASMIHEYF